MPSDVLLESVASEGLRVPMPVSTWVEVDLDRFATNLAAIKRELAQEQDILLVVKADAYGHGAVEIAQAADQEGVAYLGVATLHEGMQLRQAGCRLPILALSPLLPSEIDEAVLHALDPTVGDLSFARALSDAAVTSGQSLRCHVEIDTGMGRTGVHAEEAEDFLERLTALPRLRLASVYTHFPDADSEDLTFAKRQVVCFQELLGRLARRGIHPPRVHAANSAGSINLPEARLAWLRLGLLAYGHLPPQSRVLVPELKPVMVFKSRLVQIRDFPVGASISYGRTYTTSRPARIGIVAVGYGHGYSWLTSNRGAMLVRGRRVPIVGRVTMDLSMVDVTEIPGVEVGDEVVLFGEQGDATLTLEEVARASETLPYEVMCTIGKRVTRIYVRNGRPVKLTSLVGERAEWTEQAADHFRLRALALAATARLGDSFSSRSGS